MFLTREYFPTISDRDIRQYLWHWRSILALRQYGLTLGYISFEEVIDAWLREHRDAFEEDMIGTEIRNGLKKLIFGTSEEILLAPLDARTFAIGELGPKKIGISIPTQDVRVELKSYGDNLLAAIQLKSDIIMEFPVDFDIAREAFLLGQTGNSTKHQGFTEVSPSAFARIERARAVLASRKNTRQAGIGIKFRGDSGGAKSVTISQRGMRYEIR